MPAADQPEQGTVRVEVVDRIAHDIRDGHYHPRERLVEADLAQTYAVSRSAIRSALIELAAIGLVEREANRGARVRRVSIDEAIESTEVRLTLQALCAQRAAERVDDGQRDLLRAQIALLHEGVDHGEVAVYTGANAEISRLIREISGHGTATRIIESLQNQVRSNWYPYLLPDRRVESMHEYDKVVEAVIEGDSDAASVAALEHRAHVLEALNGIREAMLSDAHRAAPIPP
ncbi:GntR family transcriptional regulator [Luethyella okanaganae]|uniref:GntR family transcriptional regulator n=1 Tax=Luethyella okanaganae TaxID=69372 RepID=A0ABW1VH34_9MICO